MVREESSLLLNIADSYDAVVLSLDTMRFAQSIQENESDIRLWVGHITLLCEQDMAMHLVEMKGAIDKLRSLLREKPQIPLPPT